MRSTIISLLAVMFVLVPVASFAGDIDSPGPPSAGSGMYTIGDIYNYLIDGTEPVISGVFREPAAGPGATMKSTKDIYDNTKDKFDSCDATPDKVLEGVNFFRTDPANWGPRAGAMENRGAITYTPTTTDQAIAEGYHNGSGKVDGDADLVAGNIKKDVEIFGVTGTLLPGAIAPRVPKTGQAGCWGPSGSSIDCAGTGQDGQYQMGITPAVSPRSADFPYTVPAWTGERFRDNGDGTVTDNLTGLIWLKNADCDGVKRWVNALLYCNALKNGDCGLSDGSSAGDWRLPNINELYSLVDSTQSYPALPAGNPFTGVQSDTYWSSTAYESLTFYAWHVSMHNGPVHYDSKGYHYYVWPVRSGN